MSKRKFNVMNVNVIHVFRGKKHDFHNQSFKSRLPVERPASQCRNAKLAKFVNLCLASSATTA